MVFFLVGIDFCRSGERSVAIHSPPLPASKIRDSRRTRTFFSFFFLSLFFFSFWRQTLAAPFWLFIIETSIFPPAWDRLFLFNVTLAELRSRPSTDLGDCERLASPARVKASLKSGLFPVPTLDEHITKHRQCISSKLKKRGSSKPY